MSIYNDLVIFGQAALIAFNDVIDCDAELPQVMVSLWETDYCGQMITGVIDSEVVSSVLVLNLENIQNEAEAENVDVEQMTLETLYHEWIHFFHSALYPDDMEKRMCHTGDLWDMLIDSGIENGFIHRREI